MRRKSRNLEKELEEFEAVPSTTELEKNEMKLKRKNVLSTGSTLLNLCCSDDIFGGLLKGKYYLLVGQPGAGKTWLSMSLFAESGLHKRFKEYNLFYDDVEAGANMDIVKYFGKKTAARIGPPAKGRTDSNGQLQENSRSVEEFYDSITEKLDEAEENKVGCIYVLDSMDALTSNAEIKKSKEDRAKRKSGKAVEKGSYSDGKAKVNAQHLRRIAGRLEKSGSILIIVCQEKIDITSAFKQKCFSGGVSLTFYSTLQIWFQIREKITVTIKGKKRDLGTLTYVKVERNRLTGKRHKEIIFPIYYNFGVDDIGAIVLWLIEEEHWTGGKTEIAKIDAKEFKVNFSREKLVRHIQDNDLEEKLKEIVFGVWREIQKLIEDKVVRKNKYE